MSIPNGSRCIACASSSLAPYRSSRMRALDYRPESEDDCSGRRRLSSVNPDIPIESSEDLPIVDRTMDGGTTRFVRCTDNLPSSHPSPAEIRGEFRPINTVCRASCSASPRADPETGPNWVPCGGFHETLMADPADRLANLSGSTGHRNRSTWPGTDARCSRASQGIAGDLREDGSQAPSTVPQASSSSQDRFTRDKSRKAHQMSLF